MAYLRYGNIDKDGKSNGKRCEGAVLINGDHKDRINQQQGHDDLAQNALTGVETGTQVMRSALDQLVDGLVDESSRRRVRKHTLQQQNSTQGDANEDLKKYGVFNH